MYVPDSGGYGYGRIRVQKKRKEVYVKYNSILFYIIKVISSRGPQSELLLYSKIVCIRFSFKVFGNNRGVPRRVEFAHIAHVCDAPQIPDGREDLNALAAKVRLVIFFRYNLAHG